MIMMIKYDKPVEYGIPVDLGGTLLSDKPKRIKTYQTAELHDAPMMQPWLWTFQSATESPQMHIAMEWRDDGPLKTPPPLAARWAI